MKTTMTKIFIVLSLIAMVSCAALPPRQPDHPIQGDYGYVKEYMTWYIRNKVKDKGIVGLSVALVDDQSIIWEKGFGYADKGKKVASTPQTVFRAGSISKVFTAMAVMKLADEGKMNIDNPLVNYLPAFRIKSRFGNTDGITPRTIMTHHSGLPRDWLDGMFTRQPASFTRLVHEIKNEYVAAPPNTVLAYSNVGVTLLGHAVQNVSGKLYADYIEENLLRPLNMSASHFEKGLSGKMASKSYEAGKEVIEYPLRDIPAGGLNTTVNDLSRLIMMVNNKGYLNNRQIISPKMLKAMLTAQNVDVPLDLGHPMGLGWFINSSVFSGEEKVYWHGGATIAHRAALAVAPKSKLGVVVMSNSGSESDGVQDIADKMMQLAWQVKNGRKLPGPQPLPLINGSGMEGTYATVFGKADFIKKSKNRYIVKTEGADFTASRRKDGKYYLKYRLMGFIPINIEDLEETGFYGRDIAGQHVIVGESDKMRFLAGVKVRPQQVDPVWRKRLGHYQMINQMEATLLKVKDLELKLKDGYLLLSVITFGEGGASAKILKTVNEKEAIIEGLGTGMGETIRIGSDDKGEEVILYEGLQFKLTRKPVSSVNGGTKKTGTQLMKTVISKR